jgi:hypothetical protein
VCGGGPSSSFTSAAVLQLNSIKVLPAKKTKNKYQTTEFIFFFLLDSERTTLAGSIPKNQFLHNKVSLPLFVIPHSSFVGHVLLLFSNSDFVVSSVETPGGPSSSANS